MRTFAIAVLIAASSGAFAWTAEQPAQQGAGAIDLSDPDNFKALEDKVNGKTPSQSGFQFYGGVSSGYSSGLSQANPYGVLPMGGRGSAFSYSPNPGFRGNPD